MAKPTRLVIAALIGLSAFVSGCASDKAANPLTLSQDKPTLLYFYTDG